MPMQKLKGFLDGHGVRYVVISHSPAFTAQEIAASAHIPGEEVAKTVIVEMDGRLVMAVVPAPCRVDLERLRQAAGANYVHLASEEDFTARFPNCEAGAMPPFGNLFDMPVYVDKALALDEKIAFTAGTHHELVQVAYEDFQNLVKAEVAEFAVH
ncbi:MAG: YbaK/EbsC family protein [Gemmatimonadales bacterium]|nr:MAG: YbaK/EbsC family protein [Gemmatimonadales bacterium]